MVQANGSCGEVFFRTSLTAWPADGYNCQRAIENLKKHLEDLICFGRHYLANSDLPKRYRVHAELNLYKRDTFYTSGEKGYLDYPFLDSTAAA